VAGPPIPVLSADVILGINKPMLVLFTSSMALACAVLPSVLTLNDWLKTGVAAIQSKTMAANRFFFMMICFVIINLT
jgi:hypothetical protein